MRRGCCHSWRSENEAKVIWQEAESLSPIHATTYHFYSSTDFNQFFLCGILTLHRKKFNGGPDFLIGSGLFSKINRGVQKLTVCYVGLVFHTSNTEYKYK